MVDAVPMILLVTGFVVTVLHVTMGMYLEYYVQTYHPELWTKFWGKSVAGELALHEVCERREEGRRPG
jgi:hypothetical protein